MKKLFLITIIISSFAVLTAFNSTNTNNLKEVKSEYHEGWDDGYCEGWKDVKGKHAYCPYPPYPPYPKYPKSIDSYQDGYNDGFKRGMRDANKKN